MGDQEGVGLSLGQLGTLFEARGQLKQAEDALSNALQMFTRIGNKPMQKKASDHLDRIREKLKARNALRR